MSIALLLPALNIWVNGVGPERAQPGITLPEHLGRAADPYLRARRLLALLTLLVVPAAWLAARRFMPDRWALLAAALTSTSLFLMSYSQQARPHGVVTALCLLGVLASMRLARVTSWGSQLIAGLLTGLALAAFPNGILALGPWAVATAIQLRRRGPTALLSVLGTLILAVPLVSWSYSIEHFGDGASDEESAVSTAEQTKDRDASRTTKAAARPGPATTTGESKEAYIVIAGHPFRPQLFTGAGFSVFAAAVWFHAQTVAVLSIGSLLSGCVALCRRRKPQPAPLRSDVVVTLAFVGPALMLPSAYGASYQRYFLPLVGRGLDPVPTGLAVRRPSRQRLRPAYAHNR
ncbi:MAG: 4-amino-4-deoxy-L-arabinose transferase-like glycosyltransferase [Pseudohongiellaceae bacterium]|jgi:4-amino-4-deoxy-L-arabinose transferase-like glycosyltransferase